MKAADAKGAHDELTFEKALARLEQIVAQLDAGDLPLDEAIELFSEGSELGKFCSAILDQAEGRLEMLIEGKDGKVEVVPAQGMLGKLEGENCD
ncbi:MAG TPA: exodeoxyribonuclease VII small subunit [Bacillota bacterium]|jgi:exodeoxyribonuclease VII small subunit|nr:exodeoxyribonuclease VII small subunit [Bacillota bacterium]